jgi:error-prone DNA polymerase
MGFYSPSQLIQDAKRHNINILPISINDSMYDHQRVSMTGQKTKGTEPLPHQSYSLRLGLRLVKGLSEKGARQLIKNRPSSGFSNSGQLKTIGLNRKDIEALASANALKEISGDRYATRWAVMDSIQDYPLFQQQSTDNCRFQHSENEFETIAEDYAATGVSLAKHPITLLDEQGVLGKFTRQTDLLNHPHRSMITVVGVVTGRQSPGTAAGVTFFTLEDDTGNVNVVVWSGTARAQKQAYLTAKVLKVKGILEHDGQVTHVIAGKLIDLTDRIAQFNTQSRDFH